MLAFIFFIAPLSAKLLYDLHLYKRKPKVHPNHPKEWAIAAPFYVYSAWLFSGYIHSQAITRFWAFALCCVMIVFVSLFLFNGLYNTLRKPRQKWWFLGTDDGKKNDAWTDRLLKKLPSAVYKIFVLTGIGVTLVTYLIFLLKK